jgi:hypothetical protein
MIVRLASARHTADIDLVAAAESTARLRRHFRL